MTEPPDRILSLLGRLYGEAQARLIRQKLDRTMAGYRPLLDRQRTNARLSERDAILITYPDELRQPDRPPLQTLAAFCERHLAGLVTGIHILPFYPSSSDEGFSVIDYRSVSANFGTWQDIEHLGRQFRLVFDAVINHASVSSAWFQKFLRDDAPFRDFFVTVDGAPDLSAVVRPRALPLLTRFETAAGPRQVWTTFSADQVDLNYAQPDLLVEIVDTLLFYVSRGAEFLRLDAVAYLWKQIGTPCIHLPQTHDVIRLFRAVLDDVAPAVRLITETNVPHEDNISYFGDGEDEAQLVYNFALPPLVLHTLQTGDAGRLSAWAANLRPPSEQATFFNFLASHDGVGLNPVRGILTAAEIEALVGRITRQGGLVSFKANPDGSQSPYELNVNYLDALADPEVPGVELQVARLLAAHAIMLSIVGLPAIYFHSLFGSHGWTDGPALTGSKRSVNREKLQFAPFERELANPGSTRRQVFSGLGNLLNARASHPAFDPYGSQKVMDCGREVFALLRGRQGPHGLLCLQNVSAEPRSLQLELPDILGAASPAFRDLVSGETLQAGELRIALAPYQTRWLAHHEADRTKRH